MFGRCKVGHRISWAFTGLHVNITGVPFSEPVLSLEDHECLYKTKTDMRSYGPKIGGQTVYYLWGLDASRAKSLNIVF